MNTVTLLSGHEFPYNAYVMGDSKQKPLYRMEVAAALAAVDASREGLTGTEASTRLAKNGLNILAARHKESPVTKYLRQFKDLMIILLIASGVISYFLE